MHNEHPMQTFNKQNERRGGVLIELDPLNIVENISYPTIMPLNYGIPNQLWTCNGGLLKVFFFVFLGYLMVWLRIFRFGSVRV
jgi:hypothetical protein